MGKSLGGRPHVAHAPIAPIVENIPAGSHSDSSVPLVSIHQPIHPSLTTTTIGGSVRPQTPRPRPSLQIYYVAPDASSPAAVEEVARALQTRVLRERHQNEDPAMNDRLDVYGIPGGDAQRCAAHQAAEIDARERDGAGAGWYVQRYDLALGRGREGWRRAIVTVRKPVEEWDDGCGLEVVYFDPVVGDAEGKGGRAEGPERDLAERRVLAISALDEDEARVLIGDLRHSLNWQHTSWQFDDPVQAVSG